MATTAETKTKTETRKTIDNRWTVMVFMGAQSMTGDAPMIDAAYADIREMQSIGSSEGLNICVQLHGDGGARRMRVMYGSEEWKAVDNEESSVSSGVALEDFIHWSLSQLTRPQPGQQDFTMLVLWGHAYEFAIGHSVSKVGTIEALDFGELRRLLERIQQKLAAGPAVKPKLDILGFDACDLATVEMACQLQPFARYLLGSQIGIPIPGWPDDSVLRRLREPEGRMPGPAEFGAFVVRRYCESYTSVRSVSLTLLDLDQVGQLLLLTEVLAMTLGAAINRDPEVLRRIAWLFTESQTADDKPYVDVGDLCLTLLRNSGDALVMAAAQAVGDFLISPKEGVVGNSLDGSGKPFVVEHGRNMGNTARLNGVSIYAPHVMPAYDFDAVRYLYQNFTFAQRTSWSSVIYRLATA